MARQYELNEKDIDSVIRWLKINEPGNATPERAIEILEKTHARVHLLSHEKPELLDDMYQDVKNKKLPKK
jgi:hypothetical protein